MCVVVVSVWVVTAVVVSHSVVVVSVWVVTAVVSHSVCGCCFSLGRDAVVVSHSVCGCCFSLGRDGCCLTQCVWLLFQSGS